MANKNMIQGARLSANVQSYWRAPNVAGVIEKVGEGLEKFREREKNLEFDRLNAEAVRMQEEQLAQINMVNNVDEIQGIKDNFKNQLNESMSKEKYGKEWLGEKGGVFLAYNERDVAKETRNREKEFNAINLNNNLKARADEIVRSGPERASAGFMQADANIGSDPYLTAMEKEKAKEAFRKTTIAAMVTSNPASAINFLASKKDIPGLTDIEKAEYIRKADDMLRAEQRKVMELANFEEKRKTFETERELTEKLDDMDFRTAIRTLEENEGLVSSKYFRAKQKSLLSAKGITAETRAETALDVLMDISNLDRNNEVNYLRGSEDTLAKIEDAYAAGELSLSDKRRLTSNIYQEQGKRLEDLKYNKESDGWGIFEFTYKDANKYMENNLTKSSQASSAMLEYFRTVDGEDLSNADKKKAVKSIVGRYNTAILSRKSFSNETDATKAFEDGEIKTGDIIYINGIEIEVGK